MSIVDSNSKNTLTLQFPIAKTTNTLSRILQNNVARLAVKMTTLKERECSPRNLSLQLLDFPRAHNNLDSEVISDDGDREQESAEKSQTVKWTVFGSLIHFKSQMTKQKKLSLKKDSNTSEDTKGLVTRSSFRSMLPITTPTNEKEKNSPLTHLGSIRQNGSTHMLKKTTLDHSLTSVNNEQLYKEAIGPSIRKGKSRTTIVPKSSDKDDQEALLLNTIRRKSCHCSDCGDLSKFEKKHLNIMVSSKRVQFDQEKATLTLKCPEEVSPSRRNSQKPALSFKEHLPTSKPSTLRGSKVTETYEKSGLLSLNSCANFKHSQILLSPEKDNALLSKFASFASKKSLVLDSTKADQLNSQLQVPTKENDAKEDSIKANVATPLLSSRTLNKATLITNESYEVDVSCDKKTPSLEKLADLKPEKTSRENITEGGSTPSLGSNYAASPTQKAQTRKTFKKKVGTLRRVSLNIGNSNKMMSISPLNPLRNLDPLKNRDQLSTGASPPESQVTSDKIMRINKNSVITSRRAKNQSILATYTNTSSTLFSPSPITTRHLIMTSIFKTGEMTPIANRRLIDSDSTGSTKLRPLNLNPQLPLNLDTKPLIDSKHDKTKTATVISNSRGSFQGVYSSREATSQSRTVSTGRSTFLLTRQSKKQKETNEIPSLAIKTEPNEMVSEALDMDKKRKAFRTKTVKLHTNSISLEGLKRSYQAIRNQTARNKLRDIY